MDSLQNILGKRDFVPPDEIETIKAFVQRRYQSKCKVQLQKDLVIISVKSSALASTLRVDQVRLKEECNIKDKRLVFRIG